MLRLHRLAEFIPWNQFLGPTNILKNLLWSKDRSGCGGGKDALFRSAVRASQAKIPPRLHFLCPSPPPPLLPIHLSVSWQKLRQVEPFSDTISYYFPCVYLKEHGNEADFLGFLQKLVPHRSLTLPFELFRFWLRIRGDIRNRKRIAESESR